MIFYPKAYFDNLLEITDEFLKKNKIEGILLDVDNTLIDYDRNLLEGTELWIEGMKQHQIKLCILSNTNKKDKVEKLAKQLDIPYFYFAKKPLKSGFKKAQKLLGIQKEKIAVVGDQIMTDVIGANRSGMYAILVKPLKERDIFITRIKRPIEKVILNHFLEKVKKKEKEDNIHINK